MKLQEAVLFGPGQGNEPGDIPMFKTLPLLIQKGQQGFIPLFFGLQPIQYLLGPLRFPGSWLSSRFG